MISSMVRTLLQKGGFDRESNQEQLLLKGGDPVFPIEGGSADLRSNTDATAHPLFRFLLAMLVLFIAGCAGRETEFQDSSYPCHCSAAFINFCVCDHIRKGMA